METKQKERVSQFSIFIQSLRLFSLTATLIPVLMGAMIALAFYEGEVNWYLMIIIALGSPLFQLSGNLLSEYFDYKNNVDRKETFGSSRVLVDGLMEAKTIFIYGLIALAVLIAIGMILVYYRGIPMLLIGMLGVLGSFFYSKMKYNAMGDFQIFICFGPLMIYGVFYALTGSWELLTEIFLISIPVGFLVTAILHANNTRDIKHDSEVGVKTFAGVLGIEGSKFEYYFLTGGAFLTVIILIAAGYLEAWAMIVFISLPPAIKNMKAFSYAEIEKPEAIRALDVATAQHHMMFGLLYSISIFINYF